MLDWNFPYASRRAPVFARNVVATSQPLAAQAGLNALRSGGNAIDAAIACAVTLTVVEPAMNGVGSDAFAIIWNGNELVGINGSGKSPSGWKRDRFSGTSMPRVGWNSVTVPGCVSVWAALSERFGKLPFEQLFTDAVDYAEKGFQVGTKTAAIWAATVETFSDFKPFQKHFAPNGIAPVPGELFRRPELAKTLEKIASTKGEDFYRGELAQRIAQQARDEGGVMTLEDLDSHRILWTTPLAQSYRDISLHEIPPNGQGLAAQIALAILDHTTIDSMEPGSDRWVHYQVEAMKIAIRASFDHFADPRAMRIEPSALLEPDSIRKSAASIDETASPLPPLQLPISHDTVYLCTADDEGNMVSMIQSNFQGFGSGVVIDGTGISMQNRGAGFSLEKEHPNEVAGGRRPFHTIIPGFVTQNREPKMAFGVMGGHMQHQGHVQMVTRIFDHHENPQAASDAPRWHVGPNFDLLLEEGTTSSTYRGLIDRGHHPTISKDSNIFGGAQLIYKLKDGYCAASDHRKEGMATGY